MAGERVSNLKVLKGYLYADVRLGHTETGAEVTVNVRLNTARPEVREALQPLEEVLRATGRSLAAQGLVAGTVEAAESEARAAVLAQVPKRIEQTVDQRSAEVKAALRVVAAVGPPQDTETYDTKNDRRTALRRLRDALNRANI